MTERSQSPAARRQRSWRQRRKAGLRVFKIVAHHAELIEGVRQPEEIPADKPVPNRMIENALNEGFAIWLGNWLDLKRHR